MTNEKKVYTTEDNIRRMTFLMKDLLEETKKISEILNQIYCSKNNSIDNSSFPY